MRICLVYDCLFPYTVGGAERRCRELAQRLALDGHDVTYLTLRQWEMGVDPNFGGVTVVAGGPRMALYVHGRRRILPPLVFGAGVFCHLLRHGRSYDVVHTVSFPYFSLIAAGILRRPGGYRLVVDWFEVWTRAYWEAYLGKALGWVGWRVQRLCMRFSQRAFCFSLLHSRRLGEEGYRGEITVLEGAYSGPVEALRPHPSDQLVVFAGRHIPEKRVPALVPAVGLAREKLPALRCVIYGDGPERGRVLEEISRSGLTDAIEAPGFVASEEVEASLRAALCMVLPSSREGYGLIVVEAASMGVPSVVVRAADNAAVDLIAEGENGFVAASGSPRDLADAILRVHEQGEALRLTTAAWYTRNASRLSLDSSLTIVAEAYRRPSSARR